MIFVGIDFSLNSPAFCVLADGKYHWGSITRSDRDRDSLLKNAKKPYAVLSASSDFRIEFLDRKPLPDEYSERERIKIDYFLDVVLTLWNGICDIIDNKGEEVKIAMEGLSFSSNGNALIDISMATALLRERICSHIGSNNFYVFSPTSIKKFALKGNAKKDELYEALSNREKDGTNLDNFCKTLADNKSEWVTGAKAVNKPVDDLVDATWILLYLREILEGKNEKNLGKTKSKKKKLAKA
jgi:hypothetical protein